MADAPELNTLARFRKQPGRLVLEAHGGCEVPAGCGGVILRWRNPLAAQPFLVHLYAPVSARCFFDGVELRLGGLDLAPGPHVLTIALESADLSGGLLMFATTYNPGRNARREGRPAGLIEGPPPLLSQADGTWLYALDEVAADWPALVAHATPQIDYPTAGAFQCHRCTEAGAAFLGLPLGASGTGPVWIRKAFEVPAPTM